MLLVFVAVACAAHEAVHRHLPLGARANELVLFLSGALLLQSGHAYRRTHLFHHAHFPRTDDVEGAPARMSVLGAIAHGPTFLPRLWLRAWRDARREERRWLLVEALLPALGLACGVALLHTRPGVLVYVLLALAGGCGYAWFNVHAVHDPHGASALERSTTLRGVLVPRFFLGLTYHLEHHLCPAVPAHRLPELARRLDPLLARRGVRPRRVP
jgi:fatty acid desaturase